MVKPTPVYEPPVGIVPTVEIAGRRTEPLGPPSTSQQRITWSPVGTESNVPFSGSSYLAVRKALIETFGPFPIVLRNPEHLLVLQAMAAAAGGGGVAYDTLRRALANLSGIEVRDY